MSRENEITIEVYERFGDKYLERRNLRDGKNDRRQEELLKTYVKGLPKNAKILKYNNMVERGPAGLNVALINESLYECTHCC